MRIINEAGGTNEVIGEFLFGVKMKTNLHPRQAIKEPSEPGGLERFDLTPAAGLRPS